MPTSGTGNFSKGFTLLELVVAIFIVALMLALAMPSLSDIGSSRIKTDARKTASIVRYLNDSGLTTKQSFFLKVDFREKTVRYSGPDGEKKERFGTLSAVDVESKGPVTDGELVLFFGPMGASEAFRFLFREEKKELYVVFNPLSGRVKITENQE